MIRKFKTFLFDEDGAVTIDWVVITAAVVGLSAISFSLLETSSTNLVDAAAAAVDTENDF